MTKLTQKYKLSRKDILNGNPNKPSLLDKMLFSWKEIKEATSLNEINEYISDYIQGRKITLINEEGNSVKILTFVDHPNWGSHEGKWAAYNRKEIPRSYTQLKIKSIIKLEKDPTEKQNLKGGLK